ncbi:hypothetical protein CYMTET_39322 [Cymbomonas tetramitiformis]|uniref:SGNH hydrolase-type esterase domain-containing protein n=1 Tax=Cymbomonas tetramitiformis TaxID=36881 RepID=A0AAE0CCE3_9CHLO|nr:hypothetical protein CYMTET_39322 [Cymbomonas tetramitiformis]
MLESAESATALYDNCGREFSMGLGARLKKARASNQEYDTVVILTGTNDLGRIFGDTHFPSEASPEDIAERIRQLHSVCYENGIQQTFLLTVPPSTFSKTDDSRRAALNALLRNFCACEAKARLIDLDLVQLELDSDGLHLSEQGYDAMESPSAWSSIQLLPAMKRSNYL